jgi:uncharacterized membrane protein HdeD (DUF308 family)
MSGMSDMGGMGGMGVASERGILSTWRKMSLVGGVLSILLGLVLLFWPGKTLTVIAALIGIWLVVFGLSRIVDAFTGRTAGNTSRGFSALSGVIYIIAGVIVLANLQASLKFVAVLFGVILICSGLSEIISGIARVRGAGAKILAIAMGLINIAVGVVVLFWPDITLVVLAWIAALWLILLGLVQLYFAYRAGKAAKEFEDPAYHVVDGI